MSTGGLKLVIKDLHSAYLSCINISNSGLRASSSINPCSNACKTVSPSLFCDVKSAPAHSNIFNALSDPLYDALIIGVYAIVPHFTLTILVRSSILAKIYSI